MTIRPPFSTCEYEHGASLDAKDKEGTPPLMIADGTKSNFRRWDHTAELLRRLLAQAHQQGAL